MSEMEEKNGSENGTTLEETADMPPPYPGKAEKHGSKTDGNASFLRAARAGNLDKVLEYLKGSTDINTSNANGLNALHLASKEGHVNIVTELLKRGANVDAATKKGNTALHIASLAGQEEIVKILVQNGGKVNVQSQNGFTPLYMASQENHADVVKYLLGNGASQGLATEDGFTPLAVALQQGHDKVVAVLLENDTRGKVRLPALHIAAKKDDVKAATLLLQNEHNIDGTSKSGFTPLHIASHYGNMNVGTLLIEKEADVNFKARNSILPLHVASKWGRTNMVTLLLDNGGLIDGKTRDGLCPLHCGARSGHEQVVDLLLERGANVSAKTKNGLSPLHMAAQGDHVDCARLLLYHKAPIDDVTVDYLTPLHVAAHCGNVRTAKLLLDRKCEVNARALNGFTPLHIACKKNRIKVVELLLKYGASIEATTESGLTPLHVASFMGHMNIVVYLLQHGANPDTPTVRGETALHLAARANQTDIIRILLRNGATVDAKAREQQTPLHIASRLGNENNVVLLLQHGASPDATTKDLYTPLHIAAKEGHEEVAAALLDHGASQNLTTKKGFTPLHIAAKYGNIKVVKLLLQKEADPNVQGKNGLTPLHVATHYNHVNVAMLLLENGASPHCTAKNGYTPLHIAAKKNQMDIASTLLEYGAKPNAESKNGFTPLHLAAQEGHVDMVSLLLEHEADVNCRAKNGLTPMHLAAQEDKVPVAECLVKYGAEIDPQTKAGYTPLHTACHFGQINMIRFLLEQGASVNATTKLGYTPLHQAAQQGHVLVINLLLKYKASPNAVTNTGQTPLSIAQRLGYISVVEILKHITEVEAAQPSAQDEKYKVVSPETMQETLMTDSEDEGGEDTILGDQSMSIDDMKFLGDDSITPIRSQDEYYLAERFSTTTASTLGQDDFRSHFLDDSDMGPVFEDQVIYRARRPEEKIRISSERTFERESGDFDRASADFGQTLSSAYETSTPYETSGGTIEKRQEEKLQQTLAPAPPMLPKPSGSMEESRAMYGSYSGVSFASSFDPDNVALDRHPIYSGKLQWKSFLVSFMVDARGGAMRGCRHSGVRIIVPPGKACMPTRVTCKLVKKEKLTHPPPMMEGEALASRILEMGPVGAKFQGPVIIEVPHFAALRGKEREIVILRSDNGETWREHNMEATEEAIQEALNGSFEDLESAEELYNKRITRVLTSEFPNYFAVVTRIRQETKSIGPESGMLSSTVVPQVQAVFPEGSLTKKIKVGLQAQPIPPELVSKMLGNRVAVSPIVTVEPRRRKFHKPITLTIPLPKASQKGMTNPYSSETPTLRLLCSITGGTSPAQWEDITGTTPLTFVNDCVSFTTTVSARFWLMDCQNINEAAKMATELYRDTIAVPFMAKFVVFAKSHENLESRLRVFCMTDDKMDKTLESQEQFNEIARSKDVEVLEGKPQYLEMAGNLVPVTKSGDQLYINFHGFRENRLPFTVRIRDGNQEPVGRLAFMKEPKVGRGEAPQTPICNLNIRLPDTFEKGEGPADIKPSLTDELQRKYELARGIGGESQKWYCYLPEDDQISKAELRLTDIADALQGDWVVLGQQLEVTDDEIAKIQSEYNYVGEQSLVMLHLWVQKNGDKATGNSLERALRKIGREDVIRKCMYNIEEVTDEVERAVAKVHIDQPGFDALKEELGPSRDSSMHRGMSLDVSYDEQDIMKESESVEGSETGSLKEQRPGSLVEDYIIPEVDERHGVIRTPTDEEEWEMSTQKQQAYLELAQQLDEVEPQELVQPPSPDQGYVLEQEIREVRKPVSPPIDDLIQRVEADQVHGMDDRRASLSSEEDFKGGEFGIQAKAKTKTPPSSPTSGDKGPEQDVGETYLSERLADAETLGESVQPGQARLDSQGDELRIPQKSKEQAAGDAAVTGVAVQEQLIQSEVTSSAAKSVPAPVLQRPVHEDDFVGELQTPAERKREYDEVEEVLPDGTTVKRKILKTTVKKTVTKKIRRIGPDGEVIEDVITEEIPESELSETSSMHSSLSDARDVISPVPSISSPGDLASPAESDSERPSVRVYTDTIEGEPQIETDVQEFEETLPDGSIIKRKIIKTRQKQTIIKRVVMEGPEDDLPASDEQAQLMLMQEGLPDYPDIKVYTDHAETEPETSTDVQEFEETLEDGTIVKKKVLTKTEQQMKTERTVMEGQGHIPGLADADELAALEAELAAAESEAVAAQRKLIESQKSSSAKDEIVPDVQTRAVPLQAGPTGQPQLSFDDEEIVQEVEEGVAASALSQKSVVQEDEIIPVPRETEPAPGLIEEKLQSTHQEVTESAPVVDIPEGQAQIEDMLTSPASMASDGTVEFEDAQEELLMEGDEGHLEEATGGDMQETRVVMRKQVHKKTVIRDGKEETIVTEDTHVEQDNEGPEELRDSMQTLIDQFMDGSGEIPKDPAITQ